MESGQPTGGTFRPGRPRKYATPEEAKAAKRAQDAERKRRQRARKADAAPRPAPLPPPPPPTGGPVPADAVPDLDELNAAYAEMPETPDPEPEEEAGDGPAPPVAAPMGHILLSLVDAVAPVVVAKAMRRKADAIRLSPAEMDRMGPLADAAAEKVLAGTDPVRLFIVGMASIYLAKAQAAPVDPDAKPFRLFTRRGQ